MLRTVTITLEMTDIFQILDALESRAIAYEKTAALLKGETDFALKNKDDSNLAPEDGNVLDEFFIPEECSDADEAEAIAEHFRDIIASLNKQTDELK